MASRRRFVTAAATLLTAIGLAGCLTGTDRPATGTSTTGSPEEGTEGTEWDTYRSDEFGFEIRYPADATRVDVADDYAPQIPVVDESTSTVASRTALLVARRSELHVTVGHIDVSVDTLTANLGGESRQVGAEARTEYAEFAPRRMAGAEGHEVTISRYSGTGAGTEGFSCAGEGAVVAAPTGGTLFLFVERCVPDITSDPERTAELAAVFDRMVDSIRFTE